MVNIQIALEIGIDTALGSENTSSILCHRGSLDPLVYWLDRGWGEREFFEYTGFTREQHFSRYHAVIHLVTAADSAEAAYRRWPDAHRPETFAKAVQLDQLLQHAWSNHSNYFLIENNGVDWEAKQKQAIQIIENMI